MIRLLLLLLLVGCATAPKPKQPDLCATVYDPHLCLITIDSTTFAAHGSNRCVAVRKLKKTLEERNHNPLIVEKAECGRVHE
jgi:hypothetical protein